jgi:hypothetical protein
MQLNTHYKTRVALKFTGIRDAEAARTTQAPGAVRRDAHPPSRDGVDPPTDSSSTSEHPA